MNDFGVEPEDVIQLQDYRTNIDGVRTFTGQDLRNALAKIKGIQYWVKLKNEGLSIECLRLKPKSDLGWEKGKICLRIEFIPDEPKLPRDEQGGQ